MQYHAGGLGIYDMSGNVFEWCYDFYGNYSSNEQKNPTGSTIGVITFLEVADGLLIQHYVVCRFANTGLPMQETMGLSDSASHSSSPSQK